MRLFIGRVIKGACAVPHDVVRMLFSFEFRLVNLFPCGQSFRGLADDCAPLNALGVAHGNMVCMLYNP